MIPSEKRRVLFVCVGNACRSQMAEGFARAYGEDCMIPASAGIAPAYGVMPDTLRAMAEKHIDLAEHFPKNLRQWGKADFDIVVNMTGTFLPPLFPNARTVDWEIPDPVALEYDDHCAVRDAIERRVMNLIIELRRTPVPKFRGQGSGRIPL